MTLSNTVSRLRNCNSPHNHKAPYGEQSGNCKGCGHHFETRHLEVDPIAPRSKSETGHIDTPKFLCGSRSRIKGYRGMEYLPVSLQMV